MLCIRHILGDLVPLPPGKCAIGLIEYSLLKSIMTGQYVDIKLVLLLKDSLNMTWIIKKHLLPYPR